MSLKRLGASRFRNLRQVILEPAPGFNLITGENGSGKTSLLEAAYFLNSARSFRDASTEALIMRGEQDCLVTGELVERGIRYNVGIQRSRDGSRDIRLNGEKIQRVSELARLLPVLALGPGSVDLLLGAPSLRRRFLNWGLFHVEQSFTPAWEEANRCLKQRNLILRHSVNDRATLNTWTALLAEQAERLDRLRTDYIRQYQPVFQEILARIGKVEGVELEYHRGWSQDRPLAEIYAQDAENDEKRGYTGKGFQRADVRITVEGHPASKVCSRGELKAIVWSLIFAQGVLAQRHEGDNESHNTLYLVDDLTSEFDGEHRQRVGRFLAETGQQVLLTGVDPALLLEACEQKPDQVFHVEHGEVRAG